MRPIILLLFLTMASPLSAQPSDGGRQVNLFATAWVGATTEPLEHRLPLAPQIGFRLEIVPGRVSLGVEGTLDFVRPDSDERDGTQSQVLKGLTGLVRVDLGKGLRRPYLLGFWGKMRSEEQDYGTYGGGAGLFLMDSLWGRALQMELRYRGDNRSPPSDSGRWEIGLGLGILR